MKIAIQGHPTRGHEVIQILENLGGKNDCPLTGTDKDFYYYIYNDSRKGIRCHYCNYVSKCKKYTLDEFKKEFPFKIGDRIISATTNYIGTITNLEEGGCYYIKYDNGNLTCAFGQNLKLYKEMERIVTLTLDKAKEWYKKGGELKEIALQAFSEKELSPLPRNWDEFCENNPIQDHEAFINYANGDITICKECAGSGLGVWKRTPEKDRCKCVSQKSAEAHLAMMQLEQLRNCWWDDWKPDWLEGNVQKYVIQKWRDRISIETTYVTHSFLSFPTYEMAKEFLECFRDLIEIAGDLI